MANGYIVVPAADAWTVVGNLSEAEAALGELCRRRQLLAVLVRAPGDRMLVRWQAASLLNEDVTSEEVLDYVDFIRRVLDEMPTKLSSFWIRRVPRMMTEGWPREALRREWNALFLACLEERLRGVMGRRARRAQLLFWCDDKHGICLRQDVVAKELDNIRAGTADPFLASAVMVQTMTVSAPTDLLPAETDRLARLLQAYTGGIILSSLTDLVQASQ